MEATLRPMTASDMEAVERIENQCFSDAWSAALLSDMLDSQWDEVWVLETSDGVIPAYANFRFLAGEGELMRIAVLLEYRGQGLSRQLMDRLVMSANEKQVLDVTLEVRAGNETAINLYKSYGFKEEAVRKQYYHDPEEDALIMWIRGFPEVAT